LSKRIVFGILYGLLIFVCTTNYSSTIWLKIFSLNIYQYHIFYILVTFFLAVGFYECIKLTGLRSKFWILMSFFLTSFIYYRFSYNFFHQYFYLNAEFTDIIGFILFITNIFILFKFPRELENNIGKTIFIVLYLCIPFGFALGLPDYLPYNHYFSSEVFMLFVLIWSSDSFAYFAGSFFGKHKMAPNISPKKTWEGFAGGVFCTIILGYFLELYFPEMKGNWIIVGLLVAIFAPLGDLAESKLKRIFGVKDSGNIIPGHGGILDRLDSFIFCVPVIYFYFKLII